MRRGLLALLVSAAAAARVAKEAEFAAECAREVYYRDHIFSASQGWALQSALHELVMGHRTIPYTDGDSQDPNVDPDVGLALEMLDEVDSDAVVGLYSRKPRRKSDKSRETGWNREHTWPKSYGVGESGADTVDVHALRACDWQTNTERNNKVFKDCRETNSRTCVQPAHGEAAADTAEDEVADTWLPPAEVRGDIARGLFYMETRYDGADVATTNLTLAPCKELYAFSASGNRFHGDLVDLLQWHCDDPVDAAETRRNDAVCDFWQGNRNPFVDFPDLVFRYYGDPAVVFERCRACVDAGAALGCDELLQVALASFSSGQHRGLTCADLPLLKEVYGATPAPAEAPVPERVFINEFHYDNRGLDVNEAVEVAAPAGTDLRGWTVVLYDGNRGAAYYTATLTEAAVPDAGDGVGFVTVAVPGIQNGPDAVALVDADGLCRHFLGYEKAVTAVDGPARGLVSELLAVQESGATDPAFSLQLAGTGRVYSDFSWGGAARRATFGAPNAGQAFSAVNVLVAERNCSVVAASGECECMDG